MIWQRLICGLVVIYLVWQLGLGVLDFTKGRVLVRRRLVASNWRGFGRHETVTPYLLDRQNDPVAFWFWTLAQAFVILTLIGLFTVLLVSR